MILIQKNMQAVNERNEKTEIYTVGCLLGLGSNRLAKV